MRLRVAREYKGVSARPLPVSHGREVLQQTSGVLVITDADITVHLWSGY